MYITGNKHLTQKVVRATPYVPLRMPRTSYFPFLSVGSFESRCWGSLFVSLWPLYMGVVWGKCVKGMGKHNGTSTLGIWANLSEMKGVYDAVGSRNGKSALFYKLD